MPPRVKQDVRPTGRQELSASVYSAVRMAHLNLVLRAAGPNAQAIVEAAWVPRVAGAARPLAGPLLLLLPPLLLLLLLPLLLLPLLPGAKAKHPREEVLNSVDTQHVTSGLHRAFGSASHRPRRVVQVDTHQHAGRSSCLTASHFAPQNLTALARSGRRRRPSRRAPGGAAARRDRRPPQTPRPRGPAAAAPAPAAAPVTGHKRFYLCNYKAHQKPSSPCNADKAPSSQGFCCCRACSRCRACGHRTEVVASEPIKALLYAKNDNRQGNTRGPAAAAPAPAAAPAAAKYILGCLAPGTGQAALLASHAPPQWHSFY